MRMTRFFAGLLGFALLTGQALAQPQSGTPPAPAPSTDPALSPAANARYLAENAKKPGVITRASGLQYRILRNGYGRHPTTGDTVEVYYTGKFINGQVFDGTSPGLPGSFNITASGLIQGWIEALPLMRVGDQWEITIPARLAYGSRGRASVPPEQVLIFDLRLLSAAAPKRGELGYVPQPGEQK